MKIKKCYELRNAGEKIILRHLSAPNYEMETLLVADEVLTIDDFKADEGIDFFVLKYDKYVALCFVKRNKLSLIKNCQSYYCQNNQFFYCIDNVWSVLTSDLSAQQLGIKINKNWDIFVEKQKEGMVINYYSSNILFNLTCSGYEVLSGYGIENLPLDIIKIKTKNQKFILRSYTKKQNTISEYK